MWTRVKLLVTLLVLEFIRAARVLTEIEVCEVSVCVWECTSDSLTNRQIEKWKDADVICETERKTKG